MDSITGEVLTTEVISGDVLPTQEINGNVNLPSYVGATTWQELTLKPFETLGTDFSVDDDGVLHVNGGGTPSNAVWYPTVSDNGDISWEKSDSETAPIPKNIKGDKGDKGDTGEQGIQGLQGIQGEKGEKGDTGSQGIQGVKGDTGEKGADGTNGIDGADGKSAYEVAILNGYIGTQSEWLLSLKGEQGIQGVKGDTGETGATGANGIDGTDGKSAYQSAIDGGFTGTESEFNEKLATAEQNVQVDWSQTDTSADDYIKNKPTIPEAYTLPTASTTVKGGIKVDGTSITVDENGVASASGSGMVTETIAEYSSLNSNVVTLTKALSNFRFLILSTFMTVNSVIFTGYVDVNNLVLLNYPKISIYQTSTTLTFTNTTVFCNSTANVKVIGVY